MMAAGKQASAPRSASRDRSADVGRQPATGHRRGSPGMRPSAVPATVRQVLESPGRSLDGETREEMGAELSHDFTSVRIHDDADAAVSANDIGARAYTFGKHVVFGPGAFSVASSDGRALLAHELTHVAQQAGVSPHGPHRVSAPGDAAERHAGAGLRPTPVRPAPADTVHRQQKAGGDPNDLTGTTYANFHPTLQAVLAKKFPKGNHATLAEALNELTNVEVSVLARVGSRVSEYDPAVWDFITSMPVKGGWITDNWGMFVSVDMKGMSGHLAGSESSKKWCEDNRVTALFFHGTTDCWREPAGGNPGLHIPVRPNGTADIHIDFHQPVDNDCSFQPGNWVEHAKDVELDRGAQTTGIAKYGYLRDQIGGKAAARGVSAENIAKAKALLDSIEAKVREYASKGTLQGASFEGDAALAQDSATMAVLNQADALLTPPPPQSSSAGPGSAESS